MLPADPTLSLAERVDAACDRFKAEWNAGKKPRIDFYLSSAQESDRKYLREALLALELELQGKTAADTSVTRSSIRTDEEPTPIVTVDHLPEVNSVSNSIGRFIIRGLLGSGAFGKVYRVFDPQLGREVALKVPLAARVQSEKDRIQFLKEARSAAKINHPNICQVHEVGEAGGRPYIVMSLVPGQSLAATIKSRKEPLPEKQVAIIVRKIALALAAAHDKGVVHRDLKPANIMFDRERKEIVVMDFGLARGPQMGDVQGTQSGVIMGTPAYMSPEQARGDAKGVGPQGDIFSLGVIMYELLTGVRPFQGTATEIIGQILHVEPLPPSHHRSGISARLEATCLKAMAKEPRTRFASMKELVDSLDLFLKAPARPHDETMRGQNTRLADSDASARSDTMAEVFAILSDDRKQTAAAVEAAIAKQRVPRWTVFLFGALLFAGLATLAGIVFFTRSDKVKVTIELTDVDLSDKSLSFFLDEQPISAEALANPIELTTGEHVLVVKRGKEIVKRMLFTVSGGRNPGIRVKDITPPSPAPAENQPKSTLPLATDKDFVPLFNGKDLTGWKSHPTDKGKWIVEDGVLTSGGVMSHLFTERGNYEDFIFRIEAKINAEGNGGQFFRCDFRQGFPLGYEAQINVTTGDFKTGTLYPHASLRLNEGQRKQVIVGTAPHKADEWFTQEVTAIGNRITIKVNGQMTVDFVDENNTYRKGYLALQVHDPGTTVSIRKAEIKELPKIAETVENNLDREFVEYLLKIGIRRVTVKFADRTVMNVEKLADMPARPFRVLNYDSWGVQTLTDEAMEPIYRWIERDKIEAVRFFGSPIGDVTVGRLVKLPSIKRLQLGGTQITSACIPDLASRSDLIELGLQERPITDEDFEKLSKSLVNLEELNLANTRITDSGLAHLKQMKKLIILDLNRTGVTIDGLDQIKHLPVERLHLNGLRIRRPVGLSKLRDFANLKYLTLIDLGLTDRDLSPLTQCPQLIELQLHRNLITDEGLKELAKMKQLKRLILGIGKDTNPVTAKGVEELKKALPGCTIDYTPLP